ncbi:hypothetical protein HOT49_gp097 [Erwinia phage vB_EamM_Alexandra]|uniref:Uncharacterized protein n=1 Tax=Erwinia phage vB_EamM_Alexandra TaxID=2201424 RepID=A0A2Z4QE59_9CAUD|nr:hypothetical protein HOT49_gp097 [Erwinia phage vB_EamM_Alexandra]AWY08373.1 hypothetical protein Alexandra_98 [Erwinia phage vB_EamM_Alexandra]
MQMALLSTDSVLRYASFFDETTSKDIKSLADWRAKQGEARATVYDMTGRTFRLNPIRGRLGSTYFLTKLSYMSSDVDFSSDDQFSLSAIPMEGGTKEYSRRGHTAFLSDIGPSWAGGYGVTFGTNSPSAIYLVPDVVRALDVSVRISIPQVGITSYFYASSYPTYTTMAVTAVSHFDASNSQSAAFGQTYENYRGQYLYYSINAGLTVNTKTLRGITFNNATRTTSFPTVTSGPVDKRTASLPVAASTDESVNLAWAAVVVSTGTNDLLMYRLDASDFTVPADMIPGDVYQGTFADALPLIRRPAAIYNL